MTLDLKDVRWLFFDLGYTLINEDRAANDRLEQASRALAEVGKTLAFADSRSVDGDKRPAIDLKTHVKRIAKRVREKIYITDRL